MIDPSKLHQELLRQNITFYTGVPDSLLQNYIAYINDNTPPTQHITTANEGTAVATAVGHYIATRNISLVYMQNSGLGNATNPLVSLADAVVYAIPLLLLIGWRGEPGVPDEPQHIKQGAITLKLLKTLDIPFEIIDANSNILAVLKKVMQKLHTSPRPVALVVRKGTFSSYTTAKLKNFPSELTREQVITTVINSLAESDAIVTTTGKASRELFEIRTRADHGHAHDFLTVGSMGHASSIALGIALAQPQRLIYCLDGDGAALMHLGSLATIGRMQPANLRHIIINNGVHDSVGSQQTTNPTIDFLQVAQGCHYRYTKRITTLLELQTSVPVFRRQTGPALLDIAVRPGARQDLGRPTTTPQYNKQEFMDFLRTN